MGRARGTLLLSAAAPLAASFAVLDIAGVGERTWMMHLVLLGCAGVLIGAGQLLDHSIRIAPRTELTAAIILLATLVGMAAPLFGAWAGPHRWVALGSLNLYVAPVLLPALLAASSSFVRERGMREFIAIAVMACVAVLLALQPDASQSLALLVSSIVLLVRYRARKIALIGAAVAMTLATAWAFVQPDPLEPVPHVEGVFELALARSLPIGVAVIVSAIAFVAGLVVGSLRGPPWLMAVGAYYAVLFACSVAGLTPAPLIGFGAGPLLGLGLLTGVSGWFDSTSRDLNR